MEEQSNKTRNPLVIQQFISNCIAVRIKIVTMDCVEIRVFDDQYNAASITGIGVNSLLRMLKLLHTTLSSGKEQGFTFLNEEKTMVVASRMVASIHHRSQSRLKHYMMQSLCQVGNDDER